MIEQTYKLDLVPQGMVTVVHVSQYDMGSRTLTFELFKDGATYNLPSEYVASISGKKPDNTIFYYAADSTSGNRISFNLREQMTTVAGDVDCKVVITASGQQISTTKFVMVVEATPTARGITPSQTDIDVFERLVTEAQAAVAAAMAQADRAESAAASVEAIPVPTVIQIWTNTIPS